MEVLIPNIISTNINSSLVENSGDSLQHIEVTDSSVTDASLSDIELTKKILSKMAHVNPISTEIDIESVAYQLSNYQFSPDLKVTVDELLQPKYDMDYEAHPANP